jgi:tRNA A58 N-methylase Trm61
MFSPVSYVHHLLRAHLVPGDVAIDATVGNGNDTVVLAELVGPTGTVVGFDVQQVALDVATAKLAKAGLTATLHRCGHETMLNVIPPALHGRVRAVTFNLGYLPGSDHTVTTMAVSTVAAIDAARHVLAPDGLITVVCYRHEEGQRELDAVRSAFASIPAQQGLCIETRCINRDASAPVVFAFAAAEEPQDILRR